MVDLSIVIPCYHSAKTVANTLKSLEIQTDQNFEIVIVEDGPSDTKNMEQNIIINANYPNGAVREGRVIHVVEETNEGPSKTRNRGINHSHGKYIMFLDSDDMLFPNAVQTLRKAMEDDPDVIIGKTLREMPNKSFLCVGHEAVTWLHGRAYKRDFIENHCIRFPEFIRMSEDLAFNSIALEYADKVLETDFPIHLQRYTVGGLSHSEHSARDQAMTYIKNAIYYTSEVSKEKPFIDMKMLPQFIAMSYFYLDAIPTLFMDEDVFVEVENDFRTLCELIHLEELMRNQKFSKQLNDQLLLAVRPYPDRPLAPRKGFAERYRDAITPK